MPEFTPTVEQLRLLGHDPSRHARVLAGPGTGKSSTLVALINEISKEENHPRVRLLTFTRAASAELALKVSEHPSVAAQRPSTIHSFAISVLLSNPGAGNLPEPLRIADTWETKQIVFPSLARRLAIRLRRLKQLVNEMSANWESLRPEEDREIDPQERARFLGAWNEHRQIYGYTLLAELPYALRTVLRDHADVDGMYYDLLIVDEYQDLNACDLDVLRLIANRGCSVIAAGDDDQSIYSFRKAAPEGIRQFPNQYPDCIDYSLSITQRCASKIIEWANYVIQGDPDRSTSRPCLTCAEGSPTGQVALLSFQDHDAEAKGIAALADILIHREGIPPAEILILLRSDHNDSFSEPIKEELNRLGIPFSDPEAVSRLLAEATNRWLLATFRLTVNRHDSIAWATLLRLTHGIGDTFVDQVYESARQQPCQFGTALLTAYEQNFLGFSTIPARHAKDAIHRIWAWLDSHTLPEDTPTGWGQWMLDSAGDEIVPAPTDELKRLLLDLDEIAESEQGLNRYLSQITPLAKDLALARNEGIRLMTMGGAKGLTACATIVGAVEEGIVPRFAGDLGEERRLLYVAMTRAKHLLFCTWARRRQGPTARAGTPIIGAMRQHSTFLNNGPVESQDGAQYISQYSQSG